MEKKFVNSNVFSSTSLSSLFFIIFYHLNYKLKLTICCRKESRETDRSWLCVCIIWTWESINGNIVKNFFICDWCGVVWWMGSRWRENYIRFWSKLCLSCSPENLNWNYPIQIFEFSPVCLLITRGQDRHIILFAHSWENISFETFFSREENIYLIITNYKAIFCFWWNFSIFLICV